MIYQVNLNFSCSADWKEQVVAITTLMLFDALSLSLRARVWLEFGNWGDKGVIVVRSGALERYPLKSFARGRVDPGCPDGNLFLMVRHAVGGLTLGF